VERAEIGFVTDGIQLAPCPACLAHGWVLDETTFTWFRCAVCNPEPPKKQSAVIFAIQSKAGLDDARMMETTLERLNRANAEALDDENQL